MFHCTPSQAMQEDAQLVLSVMDVARGEEARDALKAPGDEPPAPEHVLFWKAMNDALDDDEEDGE